MSKVFGGTMSKTFALVAALFSSLGAANLYQVPIGSQPFPTDYDFTTNWDDDSCTISRSKAFDILEGPSTFSTAADAHINSPKITPLINRTNWEQWEFDGLSHNGLSLFLTSFSRDYSYHFFGKGNLRMEVYMNLADGTSVRELDYVDESIVIDCPTYTAGIWNSSDKSYSFHATKDLKHIKLEFDSWRVNGTYKLSATTPPVHADGSLWDPEGGDKPGVTELSPGLYYSVPVVSGEIEVDAVVSGGRRLGFRGRGGSTRLWASDGWLGITEGWKAIRAWAGPYTFTYWQLTSRKNWGTVFYSGHLFYHGQLLVGTRVGNVSDTDDYARITANFDAGISGRFADKNTGNTLEFVSPSRDKKWRFELEHILVQYEMGVGNGDGLSGFADRVVGGEVGGLQYEGRGQTEQTLFPEYVSQWVTWLIFGVGFLGPGKDYALEFVSWFF